MSADKALKYRKKENIFNTFTDKKHERRFIIIIIFWHFFVQ